MNLTVSQKGAPVNLRIPTRLLLNPVTAFFLCRKARKRGIAVSYRQAASLMKAVRTYRRTHDDWVLLEVTEADGGRIQLVL